MNAPRFSFPEPTPRSIGDRLLVNASKVSIELWRFDDDRFTVQVELRANLGNDLDDDESDSAVAEREREQADALSFARSLLGAFAAGKDGAA